MTTISTAFITGPNGCPSLLRIFGDSIIVNRQRLLLCLRPEQLRSASYIPPVLDRKFVGLLLSQTVKFPLLLQIHLGSKTRLSGNIVAVNLKW